MSHNIAVDCRHRRQRLSARGMAGTPPPHGSADVLMGVCQTLGRRANHTRGTACPRTTSLPSKEPPESVRTASQPWLAVPVEPTPRGQCSDFRASFDAESMGTPAAGSSPRQAMRPALWNNTWGFTIRPEVSGLEVRWRMAVCSAGGKPGRWHQLGHGPCL